jgi:large-conductance mechanosensitive channel
MKLGKWLGLAVGAVILAEGIWAILVSLTRSLLLPLLARVLGGDSHSPLYLGTGEINVPDIFAAILQLCLAGILFLIIKAWAGRPDEVRSSPAKKIVQAPVSAASATASPTPALAASKPAVSMAAAAQTNTAPSSAPPAPATPSPAPAQAQTAPPAPAVQVPAAPKKSAEKPAAPPKPQKPREVYYNLVGEPINPTEDE